MSRRDLLTDDERRVLFDVPEAHDALVRLYTLSRLDAPVTKQAIGTPARC